MTGEQITGFFLSFPESDSTYIRERLSALGYSPESDGLKEFIIDALDETEEDEEGGERGTKENLIRMAVEYVQDNPEQVEHYKRMFGQAFTRLMKKTTGK